MWSASRPLLRRFLSPTADLKALKKEKSLVPASQRQTFQMFLSPLSAFCNHYNIPHSLYYIEQNGIIFIKYVLGFQTAREVQAFERTGQCHGKCQSTLQRDLHVSSNLLISSTKDTDFCGLLCRRYRQSTASDVLKTMYVQTICQGQRNLLFNEYRGFFPSRRSGRGVNVTTHIPLVPRVGMSECIRGIFPMLSRRAQGCIYVQFYTRGNARINVILRCIR